MPEMNMPTGGPRGGFSAVPGPPVIPDSNLQEQLPRTEEPRKKGFLFGMGCLGCGALGCLGVIIILAILTFVGFDYFNKNIISDKPLEMPAVTLNKEEQKNLDKRMKKFRNALKKESGEVVTLKMTAKEVNYLIQKRSNDPGAVSIEPLDGDKLIIKMSIPLSEEQRGPRKFVNFQFGGKFEVKDYDFNIQLERVQIGKFTMQGRKTLERASKDLSRDLPGKPEYTSLPVKIKNFKVKDKHLIMELKVKTPDEYDFTYEKTDVKDKEPTDVKETEK